MYLKGRRGNTPSVPSFYRSPLLPVKFSCLSHLELPVPAVHQRTALKGNRTVNDVLADVLRGLGALKWLKVKK